MFIMMLSEHHFGQLWSKVQPTERHNVQGLPTRSLLLLPMNLLVFVKDDTIIADGPAEEEPISIAGLAEYLQAAKVTRRLSP